MDCSNLRGEIDDVSEYSIDRFRESVQCGVVGVNRQEPGLDRCLLASIVEDHAAGHVPYGVHGKFDQCFRVAQVTELDGIIIRKVGSAALTDHLTNPAVRGNSEVVLGDCDLQFSQNIIVRLGGSDLVILDEIALGRCRLVRTTGRQESGQQKSKESVHNGKLRGHGEARKAEVSNRASR